MAAVFALLAILGGVVLSTTTSNPDCGDHCQPVTATPVPQVVPRPSPVEPAALQILPLAGAKDISPDEHVMVTANSGTLDNVGQFQPPLA